MTDTIQYCKACEKVIPLFDTHMHKVRNEDQCTTYVASSELIAAQSKLLLAVAALKDISEFVGMNFHVRELAKNTLEALETEVDGE